MFVFVIEEIPPVSKLLISSIFKMASILELIVASGGIRSCRCKGMKIISVIVRIRAYPRFSLKTSFDIIRGVLVGNYLYVLFCPGLCFVSFF